MNKSHDKNSTARVVRLMAFGCLLGFAVVSGGGIAYAYDRTGTDNSCATHDWSAVNTMQRSVVSGNSPTHTFSTGDFTYYRVYGANSDGSINMSVTEQDANGGAGVTLNDPISNTLSVGLHWVYAYKPGYCNQDIIQFEITATPSPPPTGGTTVPLPTGYDQNYIFFTPLVIAFVAVAVFLAGWLPVYLFIIKFLGMVTGFFKNKPSRNILRIQ